MFIHALLIKCPPAFFVPASVDSVPANYLFCLTSSLNHSFSSGFVKQKTLYQLHFKQILIHRLLLSSLTPGVTFLLPTPYLFPLDCPPLLTFPNAVHMFPSPFVFPSQQQSAMGSVHAILLLYKNLPFTLPQSFLLE